MKLSHFWPLVVLFIASLFLVWELFLHPGRNITFDGHIHITTIAQFTQALKDNEFPVTWSDGFSTYGLPLPLIAHQTTAYLGGFINLFLDNVVLSYNLLFAISAILSGWLFYFFCRRYLDEKPAVVASLLFLFAPYRIINIYIRGALPEFFSSVFILVILIGLGNYFIDRKKIGLIQTIGGLALLALTHPMMAVIGMFLIGPYFLFILWSQKNKVKNIGIFALLCIVSFGIASYYVLPLLLEVKYFYQGLYPQDFPANMYFTFQNFFDPHWYYFFTTHPGPRGHFIQVGLWESLIGLLGLATLVYLWFKKRALLQKPAGNLLVFAVVAAVPMIFMTLSWSHPLYTHIFFLKGVQFPWRMLSVLMFIPPLILGVLLHKISKNWVLLVVVLCICILRFPQVYGKNFVTYPQSQYYFNQMNLHGQNLTPIWAGNAQEYAIETEPGEIIDGQGELVKVAIRNASRKYLVTAQTPLRLVDYTFYFPGWKVVVDGQETPIEFQDLNYRGVITYHVPAGTHQVEVKYTATKVRLLAQVLTVFFSICALGLYRALTAGVEWEAHISKIHKLVNRHHT